MTHSTDAPAKIYRLVPHRERIRRTDAAQAADAIDRLKLPLDLRERLRHELYKVSEPEHSRTAFGPYAMLSVQQIGAIWKAIRELPGKDRPSDVRHVLDLALLHLRQDTGEIMLTRAEMATEMGTQPGKVSKAMGVLERMGVVILGERRKVTGIKGKGLRPYFINPHAAWNGSLGAQANEASRQEPPLLTMMRGGKPD